ncbi:MAG TPA: META domain-containing protein [Allosphingosinicella sp.]|nr:META domain-containing protein [Allosphingosinicella sp.]
MKAVILLVAATALIGAAPSQRARPYEAGGFEPNWVLTIANGRLTYDPGLAGVRPTSVPLPPRQPVPNGYRYVTRGLTVDVRHVRCHSYSGRVFADTVRVTGVAEPGCGGRPIAPPRLTATIWELDAIGGARYRHGEVNLHFAYDGVLRGNAGCSDFTVPFTERRPVVRFGRMTVSRRDCAGLGLERERRALAVFSGAARISFVNGDTLILTGRHGNARLVP